MRTLPWEWLGRSRKRLGSRTLISAKPAPLIESSDSDAGGNGNICAQRNRPAPNLQINLTLIFLCLPGRYVGQGGWQCQEWRFQSFNDRTIFAKCLT